jgi:glycine hydroxymethyltransferase
MIEYLKKQDPMVYEALEREVERQNDTLELIASENFVSMAVLEANGSVLTNKYAEGYPGNRYYGGCEYVDMIEELARGRAKKLFDAAYVNVQPHSGSQANMAVYFSYLKEGDTVLGMNLAHGGHLTHGSPVNFSGKMFNFVPYGVEKESGKINMSEVAKLAKKHQPKMIVVGASAYSRHYEFEKFRQIADDCGAVLFCDIAHPAGLVAAGVHPSPVPWCDIVATTTHKTLRGPRGGIIMMGKDYENKMEIIAAKNNRTKMMSEIIDSNVMPGIQGGPLMHIIAAKAVAFGEALEPHFTSYAKQVIKNAQTLSVELAEKGYDIVSGGTDNHVFLIDLSAKEITGKAAENALHAAGITVNKNMVPFDTRSPFVTSGIRLGTAALTTKGMREGEMKQIAFLIDKVLSNIGDEALYEKTVETIKELNVNYQLYSI